jgi:hypothetical protein
MKQQAFPDDVVGRDGSAPIACQVWVARYARRSASGMIHQARPMLRPAPRKPGGFAGQTKGQIVSTDAETLTLSVRGLKDVIALSEVEGFSRGLLTAGRQWIAQLLDLLIIAAAVGLIIALIVLFMPHGTGELSLVDTLTNVLILFAGGLVVAFVIGLLVSIPSLLGIRTVDLFTLKLGNGRRWEFGVPKQQSENVVRTLESWGIAKQE